MFYLFYRFYGHFVFRSPQPPPLGANDGSPGDPGVLPLFGRQLAAVFAAGCSYLLMAKGSTKTIRMSLSREQPPARVERAQ